MGSGGANRGNAHVAGPSSAPPLLFENATALAHACELRVYPSRHRTSAELGDKDMATRTAISHSARLVVLLSTALGVGTGCDQGGTAAADFGSTDMTASDAGDSSSPDLAAMPVKTPNWSVGGTVSAVLHAGNSWYVGGAFNRISATPAANLIPVSATGTPTACPIGSGFDGVVAAVAATGNSIYVGGYFTHYQGAPANHLAKLDATTCALDTTFSPAVSNGTDSQVLGLAIAGSSLYVAGAFTTYRGSSANRIAKLDLTSGALDTAFSPAAGNGFDNNVLAIAAAGNSLYLGGTFGSYRGALSSANRLAKLDLITGAQDTTFSPPGATSNGFNDSVTALSASATALYVGGYFSAYRGVTSSANRLTKLDLSTGILDTTFSPVGAVSNGVNDVVFALSRAGSAVYVGGRFTAYRGVAGSATLIAKLDAITGALDTTFSPAASNGFVNSTANTTAQVAALAVSGSSLFVGGTFTGYRGVDKSAYALAKLDASSGTLDASFGPQDGNAPGVSGGVAPNPPTVNSILVNAGTVWLGGRFTVYGGYSVNNLAKLDDTTLAVDTTFSPAGNNGFDAPVSALAAAGSALYIGGSFTAYRGATNSARRIAKLDVTTGALDTTFSPSGATANGFDKPVQAVAVTGTSLYVGGSFTSYRGIANSANALAKLDLTTGVLDATFSPAGATANGFDNTVQALAVSGASLYAGGSFTAYRGSAGSASAVAKIDLTSGALDATFSPAASKGFDGTVNALAVSGSSLYVGGTFTSYAKVADSARRLAKLDLTSGAIDTAFSPVGAAANGFDDYVSALEVVGNALYVGGNFTAYRGAVAAANRLAKLDLASGALDATFSPAGATANGLDATVSALAASGGVLVVGGGFSSYRGAATLSRALVLLDAMTGTRK